MTEQSFSQIEADYLMPPMRARQFCSSGLNKAYGRLTAMTALNELGFRGNDTKCDRQDYHLPSCGSICSYAEYAICKKPAVA